MVTHNLIVGGGTIAAGLFGVAFQSLMSHQFRPSDFGAVFVVVTLITFIGLPAGAFTLLMARATSSGRASGLHADSAALLHGGSQALLIAGLAIAGAVVVTAPLVASWLGIPVGLLLAAALGLPCGLAFPLLLGELQGEQRFGAFALLLSGQAGGKLVASAILGLIWGPVGVIAGISLSTIAAYLAARQLVLARLSIKPNIQWLPSAARYLAVVLPSSLALAGLLSADVFVVKHFFPNDAAGQYSAMAALGRAIFWGASGVAAVLFPKVIVRAVQGKRTVPVVGASLVMVAFGGLAGWAALSIASGQLINAFAGAAYSGAAGYLAWYSVGMTLMGGVAVLIAAHQSKGTPAFLLVLLPLTLLESGLLLAFHQSIGVVVLIVDLSMATILVGLLGLLVREELLTMNRRTLLPVNAELSVAPAGIQQ